jgi:uncharacterized protein YbjT (DUF2867 family)
MVRYCTYFTCCLSESLGASGQSAVQWVELVKIVFTGANSASGRAILRCAPEAGVAPDALVAVVRSGPAADEIRSELSEGSRLAVVSYDDPGSLDAVFRGASAIIHLAGILVERPGSTYEQANVAPTRSVVKAAKRCAVEKFVLVSATGADEKSSNGYYRSKGQSEAVVRASGLCYTILRAPLLLGPATEGGAALARNARGPKAKLIGGGRSFQQPLDVDDLARAALAATQPSIANHRTLDLVGPVSLPERELVERAARMLGHEVRVSSIPKGLLSLALAIRRRVAGPGFSPDALAVITANTRLDSRPAASELGIQLTGIDEMIKKSLGKRDQKQCTTAANRP